MGKLSKLPDFTNHTIEINNKNVYTFRHFPEEDILDFFYSEKLEFKFTDSVSIFFDLIIIFIIEIVAHFYTNYY